jgi:lipoprotein-anchoring transpeptidase ErfK/SrfK
MAQGLRRNILLRGSLNSPCKTLMTALRFSYLYMAMSKFVCVFGLYGFLAAIAQAQDNQQNPASSPSPSPFVADTTQAEQESNTSPTPTPDTKIPSNPMAPQSSEPEAASGAAASSGPPRAMPAAPQEILTRLQIFLDQRSFGPGKIDGRWGEFTAKALVRYQMSKGEKPTGQIDGAMEKELESIFPIYRDYTLKQEDFKQINPKFPLKTALQAKFKASSYREVSDFISERFHSDPDFIAKLNRGKNLDDLKPGAIVRVPNVPEFKIESIKEVASIPVNPELGSRMIKIDTRYRMLDVYDADKLICSFPITPGSKKLPAPIGTWKIIGIATMPWFRWDAEMLNHGRRSSNFYNLPPGPRGQVGILWIGLNKRGIGIHGTLSPYTIGRSGSHGCIRLANWDAARVYKQVTEGDTVKIY